MDIHTEIGEPARLEPYERTCGDAAVSLCGSLAIGVLVAAFGARRYLHPGGFVAWQAGPGWELVEHLASKLPNQARIRTGWDGPEVPEPPEPEPASTKRPDGMTTTGWDDPHGTERP